MPVTSVDQFLNGQSVVEQDLVNYVSMGIIHVPRTEVIIVLLTSVAPANEVGTNMACMHATLAKESVKLTWAVMPVQAMDTPHSQESCSESKSCKSGCRTFP